MKLFVTKDEETTADNFLFFPILSIFNFRKSTQIQIIIKSAFFLKSVLKFGSPDVVLRSIEVSSFCELVKSGRRDVFGVDE